MCSFNKSVKNRNTGHILVCLIWFVKPQAVGNILRECADKPYRQGAKRVKCTKHLGETIVPRFNIYFYLGPSGECLCL